MWPGQPARGSRGPQCAQQSMTPQGALGGMGIAGDWWDVDGSRHLGGTQGKAGAGQVSAC